MAGGHPKYGGTNGVTPLDVGQAGGARSAAGSAQYTLVVRRGAEEARVVEHAAAQVTGLLEDNHGYAGGNATWSGTLKVDTAATLDVIVKELDAKLHGHTRSASGILQAANTDEVKETTLTDYDGRTLTQRARLRTWRFTDRRRTTPEAKIVVGLEIEFRIL